MSTTTTTKLHNIIVDTDLGCDDATAIAFALNDPQTHIHAITTVFGNVSMHQAMINTFALLSLFGQHGTVPIYSGSKHPLSLITSYPWAGHGPRGTGNHRFEDDVFHSAQYHNYSDYPFQRPVTLSARLIGTDMNKPLINEDNNNNNNDTGADDNSNNTTTTSSRSAAYLEDFQFCITHNHIIPTTITEYPGIVDPNVTTAVDYLINAVNAKPHFYELVCLGPLTNVARAIQQDPTFLSKLKTFCWLGGALVGGNSTPYAEFNAHSDTLAAKIVFDSLLTTPKTFPFSTHYNKNNNNNNNENNENNNDSTPLLQAFCIPFDVTDKIAWTLLQYKDIFSRSQDFSWSKLQQKDSNITPQQHLFAYVTRRFLSTYEGFVQQAHDAGSAHITGMHQDVHGDDRHDDAILAQQEEQTNADAKKPAIAAEDDVQQAAINICDLYAMCVVLHPEVIGGPEHVVDRLYTILSDTSDEKNGQLRHLVNSTTTTEHNDKPTNIIVCDQHNNIPLDKLYPLTYITDVDGVALEQLIRQFAGSEKVSQ